MESVKGEPGGSFESEILILIKIVNLHKTYKRGKNQVSAIRGLNLEINGPEIVCLFGRSGSGKTTLLNLVGTLDQPDSGEIHLDGENIQKIPPGKIAAFRRRKVGFVFQHFNLVPYLSALENTALPLKFDRIPRKEREEKAREILEKVGLANRMDFLPTELSGGQIQRVSFARALINRPRVVLADEPTGQLDSRTAAELAELISLLNREWEVSFLIATHDPVLREISHRVVYLEDGIILEKQEQG